MVAARGLGEAYAAYHSQRKAVSSEWYKSTSGDELPCFLGGLTGKKKK